MKSRFGISWLPVVLIIFLIGLITAAAVITLKPEPDNQINQSNSSLTGNQNTNYYSNSNTNSAPVNSFNQTEGYFPPVNNDPNANTNLVNISPQTNINANDTSSKSCTTDADCGLLICSGCFSNTYLETAPPDLACRTYDGYRCACVAGQCQETK